MGGGGTMILKSCIDPGHGGSDSGAVFGPYVEKGLNLAVALRIEQNLLRYGIKPEMTRRTDISLTNKERTDIVKKCDICLSIHFNKYNTQARGIETIYQLGNEEGHRLANLVAKEINRDVGLPLRRVFSKESDKERGTNYYYMHRLTKPCTVVINEGLFLDNQEDTKKLDVNILGDQISQAFLKYLGYVEVFWKGKQLSVMGKVENGITYLPARAISEIQGLKVNYDNDIKRVYID